MIKRVAVLTDHYYLFSRFKKLISKNEFNSYEFIFFTSFKSNKFINEDIKEVDIQKECKYFVKNFDLLFSLHFKQLFPPKIFQKVKCINIHPGYNPYNRGLYSQVFSIINKLPFGATIHEIDNKIDNGKIICREQIEIKKTDTSYTLYKKVLKLEIYLINQNLKNILDQNYKSIISEEQSNLNFSKDFENLCYLDLNNVDSFQHHLDILRALTHKKYKNAYFYDDDGKKVFVEVKFSYNKAVNDK